MSQYRKDCALDTRKKIPQPLSVSTRIRKTPARSRQNTMKPVLDSETSCETEDCKALVRKRLEKQEQQQEQASNASELLLVETGVSSLQEDGNQLSIGDQESSICYLPWHQTEQSLVSIKDPDPLALEIPQRSDAKDGAEPFQSQFKEELADSSKLFDGDTETESNLALQVVLAEKTEAPKRYICYQRFKPDFKEDGKAPMKPPTDLREGTVSSDEANDISCFAEQRAQINNEPIVGRMSMDEVLPSINNPALP